MPIFRVKNAEAGEDINAKFELPQTGARYIQVRINALTFHHTGEALATWDLFRIDPVESENTPIFLSTTLTGPSNDLTVEGMVLATEEDGTAWGLGFRASGMDGRGYWVIDYDFVTTEG